MKRSWTIIISLFALFFHAQLVLADDEPAIYQAATVKNAIVTPTTYGGMSVLRLQIVNESSEKLIILGVKGDDHHGSKILVRLDDKTYTELESLSLGVDEGLDMTTSHMVVQLMDISRPLKPGQKVNFTLQLMTGDLPFTAHVRAFKKIS